MYDTRAQILAQPHHSLLCLSRHFITVTSTVQLFRTATQNAKFKPKHKLHFKPKRGLKANEVFKLRINSKGGRNELNPRGSKSDTAVRWGNWGQRLVHSSNMKKEVASLSETSANLHTEMWNHIPADGKLQSSAWELQVSESSRVMSGTHLSVGLLYLLALLC